MGDCDPRSPLCPVSIWNVEAKKEAWLKERERLKLEAEAKDAAGRARVAQLVRNNFKLHLETFDVNQPAYKLAEVLPDDVNLLSEIVNDKNQSIERRGKLLEVMILRGAEDGFEAGFRYQQFAVEEWKKRGVELPESQRLMDYQRATLDLVMSNEPALFAQVSRSKVVLPEPESARLPATEWMYTHLKDGGLLSDYKVRQEKFLPWLESLPPRELGRAMFHLGEAGDPTGTHMKVSPYVEVAKGPITGGITYQGPDGHFGNVIKGAVAMVDDHLGYNVETGPDPAKKGDRAEYFNGYVLASRGVPTPGNEK